ncbi:hypothetical protein SNEBB_000448 [Seison nebaliae]|nr:hypothetical protein SNEBB_000448 [Seison nebaliae]
MNQSNNRYLRDEYEQSLDHSMRIDDNQFQLNNQYLKLPPTISLIEQSSSPPTIVSPSSRLDEVTNIANAALQRRYHIKNSFDILCSLVPNVSAKNSKATALNKAASYVTELDEIIKKKKRQRIELKNRIKEMHEMMESYNEYLNEKTKKPNSPKNTMNISDQFVDLQSLLWLEQTTYRFITISPCNNSFYLLHLFLQQLLPSFMNSLKEMNDHAFSSSIDVWKKCLEEWLTTYFFYSKNIRNFMQISLTKFNKNTTLLRQTLTNEELTKQILDNTKKRISELNRQIIIPTINIDQITNNTIEKLNSI